MRVATSVLVALVAFATHSMAAGDDCPTVVRAWFADRAQVAAVAAWTEPWEVRYDQGFMVVGVDADGFARLMAAGLELEIDERMTSRLCAPLKLLEGQTEGIPGYPCYRTVEESFADALALTVAHPDLAQLVDIGDSWEKATTGGLPGYDMMVLKLTNSSVPGTPTGTDPPHGKPRLLVTSAIHAREYTTTELMLRFAEQLLAGYGTDADATWLLDEHEIHLVLYTNPDGRKHAETGEYWRKNTNENYCGPSSPDRGADLNRNFEFQWGCCGGSSTNPCDETYRGATAASEPETQAVEAYARAIFPDQRAPDLGAPAPADATGVYFDIHSYGELVMWPWGFVSSQTANNAALQTLGRRLAWFDGYSPDQSIGLYPTDGDTTDFAYGDLGVAAYGFELGTDFFQDCGSFEATILPDNLESLRYAAKVARTPYLTPGGPDATEVDLGGITVVAPGEPVTFRARLDDSRFNQSNGSEPVQIIAEAAAYLDAPPWQAGAVPTPMSPADGSFDTSQEWATVTIDTAGLATGRHTVFATGRDASGAWGPTSAVLFWILDPATAPRFAGEVRSAEDGQPLAAIVTTGPFSAATDPLDGSFELMLPPGTYDVNAVADGYAPGTAEDVSATTGVITPLDFFLAPYEQVLFDDVEGGNIGWTAQSPWAITTEASSSPTHSWTDSPAHHYENNRDVSLTSPALDLSGMTGTTLEFAHIYDLETYYIDYGHVEVSSDDGATWETVASYTGRDHTMWEVVTIDLPQLDGVAAARIRFRLETGSAITADGWHVDDILLRAGAGGSSPPARSVHSSDSYFIPAVAKVGGAQGTHWTTALTVLNLADSPRTAEAFYTPRESDGTTDYLAADLELGAHSSTTWEDVVATVFGTNGAGSLEIRGTDIIVSSRTSTPGLEGGSYGQGIPPLAPYHIMRTDGAQVQSVGAIVRSPAYRSNLGICEVWGEQAQVRVTLWDEHGAVAGTRTIDLPPYGNTQINDLPLALGGLSQMENGRVEVEILDGDGRVGAYLSIVDNVTGDPTYVAVGFSPPSTAE
jgi:hypothetical protein